MPYAERESLMLSETAEAADAVARFLARNAPALDALGQDLRAAPPPYVVTCARGSSDHAATFAKYLIETRLGRLTTPAAFSTVSLYHASITVPPGPAPLSLAISQSGRSPDLLATVERHKAAGMRIVALVNDEDSSLAALADTVLPLCAGPELSVAATKSYLATLAGIAALVAAWGADTDLRRGLAALPGQLRVAFRQDWSAAIPTLAGAPNLFVIGRGYTLPVAQEAALKLKETCGLHGEAFSAAEVRHGPMAIVGQDFPILGFAGPGPGGDDVRAVAAEFASRGARVWLADTQAPMEPGIGHLPVQFARQELAPLLMATSFYRMANALSATRGYDTDQPPFLSKVTHTR
ncbi:SIS domain-containing protein [Croceibacterium sp. TMG7-5b_MA50]|uniref:SIS domain-containing protein n=1 Tax=Croceibacterium sp. TMG7-5b_MA50 TaxID=3121290 RepID=UPI0032213E18